MWLRGGRGQLHQTRWPSKGSFKKNTSNFSDDHPNWGWGWDGEREPGEEELNPGELRKWSSKNRRLPIRFSIFQTTQPAEEEDEEEILSSPLRSCCHLLWGAAVVVAQQKVNKYHLGFQKTQIWWNQFFVSGKIWPIIIFFLIQRETCLFQVIVIMILPDWFILSIL